MTFCLAHIVYCRYKELVTLNYNNRTGCLATYCHIRHVVWLFFIIIQVMYSLCFYFSYGLMAYFLGFLNTWSIVIYIIIWKLCLNLDPIDFPESVRPTLIKNISDSEDTDES